MPKIMAYPSCSVTSHSCADEGSTASTASCESNVCPPATSAPCPQMLQKQAVAPSLRRCAGDHGVQFNNSIEETVEGAMEDASKDRMASLSSLPHSPQQPVSPATSLLHHPSLPPIRMPPLPSPTPPTPGSSNIGPREPLSSLLQEFQFNTTFCDKVRELIHCRYVGWRRVRGDGNCFYRAVGFGFLEKLVQASEQDRLRWTPTFLGNLRTLTYEDPSEQAAHTDLVEHFERLRSSGGWEVPPHGAHETTALGILYRSLRDPDAALDLALIRAMRHLSAKHLVERKDELASGISLTTICAAQGYGGIEDYCQKVILPMGQEAEGMALGMLPPVLGVSLRVAFLDRGSNSGLAFCDYTVDGFTGEGVAVNSEHPRVHVQLRPGHYDLVYFGEPEETAQPKERRLYRQPSFGDADGASDYSLQPTTQMPVEVAQRIIRTRAAICPTVASRCVGCV